MGLAVGLAACGGSGESATPLSVFAASSLTEAFTDISQAFEAARPGVDVRTSFAGSQTLRLQIEGGAGADVFASADIEHIEALRGEGLVDAPRVFAYNRLVVIVPLDDPAGVRTFDGLPAAASVVLGTPEVPVGRYARNMLARASFGEAVMAHVVSEEANVRQVRAKVELGEADAAIVYLTDALASDRVRAIPIPDSLNVRTEYVVALTRDAAHRGAAEAWVAFLFSDEGRSLLRERGFGAQ